ncbi:MAG TPA: adenylate kinase [Methylomirabilota bacterium]|nr:adenylate kinase [Methylomirabilota bacterium]
MIPALNLNRVVVVGTSCAGKTTLARRLADILASEHVELDSIYWGPAWTPRPDFIQTVLAIAQQPRWVIDGNYSAVRDIIWRRSSAIVWLDYSFARVFSQALRRTARRILTRERLYAGNRETVRNALLARDGIPWWVIRTHGKRRRDFPELLRRPDYRHAAVIQLDRPAAAEAFLLAVSAGPRTTNSGHTHAD